MLLLVILNVAFALGCSQNEMDIIDKGDGNKVERCDSKAKLAEILGVDIVNMKITDVYHAFESNHNWDFTDTYTHIYIFFKLSDDAFPINGFPSFEEILLEYISPGEIRVLEENGIKFSDIKARGTSFKNYEYDGVSFSEPTYWYLLDNSNNYYKGNIFGHFAVPCKMELDIESILACQSTSETGDAIPLQNPRE